MSRLFLFALLALLVGAVLAVLLGGGPGYLLISLGNYSIETSVLVALVILLLGLGLLYVIWRLLHFILPLHMLRGKPFVDRKMRSDHATLEGLRMLAHGHSGMAYKVLLEQAGHVRSPLLNYLGAALAAWQQGDEKGFLFCLGQAEKLGGGNGLSEGLLRAGLSASHQQVEESLATLIKLRAHHADNRAVLLMLASLYRKVEDWEQLSRLMPALEKSEFFAEYELTALRLEVVQHRLRSFNPARGSHQALDAIWETVPRHERNNETLLGLFVQKLIALGQDDKAQVMLIRYFRNNWDDALVKMIGFIESNDPHQQLVLLESQLKDRPNNAVLMLTLGRVSLRNKLWGKGKEYFEAALRLTRDHLLQAEINAELARLLERMGDTDRSAECYRLAMGLLDDRLPTLPYPE